MASKALFSPIKIGKNQLEHRVVMAPLTRARATLDAVPTESFVEYYSQRTSRGGLMISEATFIDRLAGGYRHVPGIYHEEQIKAWQKVTEAVHQKGGIIFMQLWHIGRVGSRDLNPNGEQVVSASDIPARGKNYILGGDHEQPRPLTVAEIKDWIERYRQAALNAIEAGFDGVEIHSSHGYLLDQFINSSSNRRTDDYGGSIPNRTRFPLQVVDAIVDAIGAHRTAIRLTPGADFQDVSDDTVVDTWSYLVSQLQHHHPDLAYLHFVQAHANVMVDTFVDQDSVEPYRKIWKGPIIVAGGYSNATEAAMDYAEKNNCLISFGRAFVANPDLPQRLLHHWPLNPYDRSTFYTHDLKGYTDYPFYQSPLP
jgi:2,4-dienoyl-CoA reductase-like NADH-dependent reductase (Old Yellow Enzyme family)